MNTSAVSAPNPSIAVNMVPSELTVDRRLVDCIEQRELAGTGIIAARFWTGLSDLVHEFGPRNRTLLQGREESQRTIDGWHREWRGRPHAADEYHDLLVSIGYIVPEGSPFEIETTGVDPEIATTSNSRADSVDYPEPERHRERYPLWLTVRDEMNLPSVFEAAGITNRSVVLGSDR